MTRKFAIAAAVAVSAMTAVPAAADARPSGYHGDGHRYSQYDRRYDSRYDRSYDRDYRSSRYDRYYDRDYRSSRYDRAYRTNRYDRYNHYDRYDRRRCSGTTGTVIGAVAGGLLGREIAGRGDRTEGAIIGGAAGALAGRAIDKGSCRR